MDLATLIGLIGASSVIVGAILVGGSALVFINPASLLIVIGGTIMVTLMKFPLAHFLGAFKIAANAFLHKPIDSSRLIEEGLMLANVARKEGILSLERQEVDNAFLNKGIALCVDGHDSDLVRSLLNKDINLTIARHESGQAIFKAIGDVAPAMGMIGTLIGLVQMLSNMDDPKQIGPAMAVALLTTLYGAIIATTFALPIADKLSHRSEEERKNKAIVLDIINGIQDGTSPRVIEEMLKNYLPTSMREENDDKDKDKDKDE